MGEKSSQSAETYIVLEYGAFVALGLLLIWVVLLILLARGTLKTIPFGAASMFLALMISFFWLGPEITELTILKVGSFMTNAEQASRYFAEIKTIRDKIKIEEDTVTAAVAAFDKEMVSERSARLAMLDQLKPRDITKKQMATIADAIKGHVGTIYIFPLADPEASKYLYAVSETLKAGGADVKLMLARDEKSGAPIFPDRFNAPVSIEGVTAYEFPPAGDSGFVKGD